MSIDKVNKAHAHNCHLRGAKFTTALLNDPLIDIKYDLHNAEVLDHLPEGAFATVSNHPIGSIDGIMLIDIFASRRPDFKVMVNGVLTKIGAMGDNFVSVKPDSNNQGANLKNINGVRISLQQLKEGHPMGFFPAGGISMYNKKTKKIQDLPWTHSVIRLSVRCAYQPRPLTSAGVRSMFISASLFLQKKSKILPTTKIWPSFYINVRTLLKNNKPV